VSKLREQLSAGAERVVIERRNGKFVISDEGGYFATCERESDALHYAADLLYGPGTSPRGTVWNLLRAMEGERESKGPTDAPA
jgi:hypothetical protein